MLLHSERPKLCGVLIFPGEIGLLVHANVSSGARYLTFDLSICLFQALCVSSEDSGDTAQA